MRIELQLFCQGAHRWLATIVLLGILASSSSGCHLLISTLELPEKSLHAVLLLDQENGVADPVELQSLLLRFADNTIETLNLSADKLQQNEEQTATQKRNLLRHRISLTHDVLAIATGANTYANLLDMVILVSLNHMAADNRLMSELYGESAKPFLLAWQEADKEIWRIAAATLKNDQLKELRAAIKTWHEQHPNVRSPRDIGLLGFASEIEQMNRRSRPEMSSVFNLLAIDPLAGLDPATRELANTRLLAERGLFLARYMPTLIRWETELLVIQTTEIPQMEELLSNIAQLSGSAERFSQIAERLPGLIGAERQQIIQALDAQRPGLVSLAVQTENALNAGKLMSDATAATLKSFQDVLRQLEASPSDPNAEPFRINDYTAAAAQINATAQDLVILLQTFEQTLAPDKFEELSARLDTLTRQAQADGKELVDYTFRQTLFLGLILIASACAMVLASAIAFWCFKKKFSRPM